MRQLTANLLPVTLLLLLATTSCQPDHRQPAAPPTMRQLEGTWLNSREEDQGDTLVFRPNTYKFPPTRGRTGFALRPQGRFTQFDVAPADGLASRPGTWTAAGPTHLRIHLADGSEPDYTLEIISLDKKVLRLRRQ